MNYYFYFDYETAVKGKCLVTPYFYMVHNGIWYLLWYRRAHKICFYLNKCNKQYLAERQGKS